MNIIDASLSHSINLKDICLFTFQYDSETALKKFLFNSFPNFISAKYSDLVILEVESSRLMKIPYKESKKYFNIESLVDEVAEGIYNEKF